MVSTATSRPHSFIEFAAWSRAMRDDPRGRRKAPRPSRPRGTPRCPLRIGPRRPRAPASCVLALIAARRGHGKYGCGGVSTFVRDLPRFRRRLQSTSSWSFEGRRWLELRLGRGDSSRLITVCPASSWRSSRSPRFVGAWRRKKASVWKSTSVCRVRQAIEQARVDGTEDIFGLFAVPVRFPHLFHY